MTKKDHECEDCAEGIHTEESHTYSDDNCTCFGEILNLKCPRIEDHKANLK